MPNDLLRALEALEESRDIKQPLDLWGAENPFAWKGPLMKVPRYWAFETSGVLRPAVEAYLRGEPLSDEQVATIRAYLRQWIMSPAWDQNPYDRSGSELAGLRDLVDSLTSSGQIKTWHQKAHELGIDAF